MPHKDPAKRRAYDAARYLKNRDSRLASAAQYRIDHPGYLVQWKKDNPEKVLGHDRKWKSNNKEKMSIGQRAYRQNNPEKIRAKSARRRSVKLNRTPSWDLHELTELIYLECPEGMTVDHIVPLQGEFVSGLHVYNNLQYMTHSENSSKGNNYVPN